MGIRGELYEPEIRFIRVNFDQEKRNLVRVSRVFELTEVLLYAYFPFLNWNTKTEYSPKMRSSKHVIQFRSVLCDLVWLPFPGFPGNLTFVFMWILLVLVYKQVTGKQTLAANIVCVIQKNSNKKLLTYVLRDFLSDNFWLPCVCEPNLINLTSTER